MKATWSLILVVWLSCRMLISAQKDVCPPWFTPDNKSSTGCSCNEGARRGHEFKCQSNSISLQFGYCMTYNNLNGLSEFGKCPYITHYITDKFHFIQLPDNVSKLNEFMCGPLNREGTLCGKCKDGYGIALYSYTLECTKCWRHGYGWVLYYFLQLFPITVLYFLVVIFHIRATSSPLSALVFMSQVMVYTIRLNVPVRMYIENEVTGFSYVALQVMLVLCSIWSLDFFRSVIPPFCVSSNIKTIHALALEYLVAFYPICLIFITYACIKLHDNNFRPVVWLWKPFHSHFAQFRRRWDTKASIVNAFTTFLLLSFSKILFVSFTLLYSFDIRYNSQDVKRKCVLYYDPTVECHTHENNMFTAIALLVLVTFVAFPTVLLILYPTRLFRKFVSSCGFQRWNALCIFVESFQGQYKDGTSGTHDFRMVSALFLILRILVMCAYTYHFYEEGIILLIQGVLFICAACFHAIARPYKTTYMNNVDIVILNLLCLLSLVLVYLLYLSDRRHSLMPILLLGVPHITLIFYICYKLAGKTGITQCLKACILTTRQTCQANANVESTSDTDSMPDRMINPGEYEPLLPNTNKHTVANSTADNEALDIEERTSLTPVYTIN